MENNNNARAAEELYKRLDKEGLTLCIRLAGGEEITSKERGIAPLIVLLDRRKEFAGAVAADKVTGKAAAFLYVLLGVAAVRTRLSSVPAGEVFSRYGIAHRTDVSCDRIINRRGDGLCPMESAVARIDDPSEAEKILRAKVEEFSGGRIS